MGDRINLSKLSSKEKRRIWAQIKKNNDDLRQVIETLGPIAKEFNGFIEIDAGQLPDPD